LVRRLVEMHGGTATAKSDGLGTGSEFEVRLPLLDEVPAHDAPSPTRAAATQSAGTHSIVVADDNADAAASLAMLLRRTGSRVETAADGVEAVATAERVRPDIV